MKKALPSFAWSSLESTLVRPSIITFLIAATISIPLIVSNSHYLDDNQRIISGSVQMWLNDGRPLTAWLLQSLSFSETISDLSPLPLIGGLAALAFLVMLSLNALIGAKPKPKVVLALTVMLNPFIAQPMLFTFDCFPILLSIGFSFVACINISCSRTRQYLFSFAIFLAALCLYQTSLNHSLINTILVAMLFIPKAHDRSKASRDHVFTITASLISAVLLYRTVIAPYYIAGEYNLPRTALVPLDFSSIPLIIDNTLVFLSGIRQGFPHYSALPFIIITAAGCFACWKIAWRELSIPGRHLARYFSALFCASAPLCVVISIPGFMILLSTPEMRPRTLTAFSSALFFFFYISLMIFPRLKKYLVGLLIFHLAFSASFMISTFRASVNQSLFDDALAISIRNDLSRIVQRDISSISFIGDSPMAPSTKPYFKNYPFASAMVSPGLSENSIFRYKNLAHRFMIYQPLADTTAQLKAFQPSELVSSSCAYRMYIYQNTAVVDFNHPSCAVPD